MELCKVGVREKKKVDIKLSIMEVFICEMSNKELGELHIDKLCEKIGISKVTFFNYFSTKEQVIEYFIYKWQYDTTYELYKKNLKKEDALRYIYKSVCRSEGANHIMNALIHFFSKVSTYTPIDITEYEYYRFNSKAFLEGIVPKSIDILIKDVLTDITDDIVKQEKMLSALLAGFYGIPLLCKIINNDDLENSYMSFLDQILYE